METPTAAAGVAGGMPPATVEIVYCCPDAMALALRKKEKGPGHYLPKLTFHHPQPQVPEIG